MSNKAEATRIFDNRVDSGTKREDILFDFLDRHLPERCNVIKGGSIFDSEGGHSRQIDLIVTNDLTLQFKEFNDRLEKSFNCIEGCYAAISVKSTLDKKELLDSIDNLASIPTVRSIRLSPMFKDGDNFLKQVPLRVIFSYKGIDKKSVLHTHRIIFRRTS